MFSGGYWDTEANLYSLADGPITQDLYYFDRYSISQFGEKAGTITTFADGSTILNYQTPVPPVFLLTGSGLIGLLGLRRKRN